VAATVEEPRKERKPRLDWAGLLRRAFALDVFACVRCGGRRRVLAYLTAPNGGRAILEHLELPLLPGRLAAAPGRVSEDSSRSRPSSNRYHHVERRTGTSRELSAP
jgi:hypothetical protein